MAAATRQSSAAFAARNRCCNCADVGGGKRPFAFPLLLGNALFALAAIAAFVGVQVVNYRALSGCYSTIDQHSGSFGHILRRSSVSVSSSTTARNNNNKQRQRRQQQLQEQHGGYPPYDDNVVPPSLQAKSTDLSGLSRQRGENGGGDGIGDDAGFGGCLMIMDDNHFLVEWLAYHYFALPLRHLTVYVDGKSKTSPMPILHRWRGLIEIEVVNWDWPDVLAPVPEYLRNETRIRNYIGRQNMFYGECMKKYRRRNFSSWVILTDTDEFIGNNRFVRGRLHPADLGSVVPSASEYGNILKRLKQRDVVDDGDACIMTNRTQACDETPNDGRRPAVVSRYLGTKDEGGGDWRDEDFLTFRWNLGHSLKNPKGMIRIGSYEREYFENMDALNNLTAHHIAPGRPCTDRRPYFKLFHYPGSIEQQTFRDDVDPRGPAATRIGGSRPLFKRRRRPIPVQHIQPWLSGFVEKVGGKEEARRLLEGVGQVHYNWPPYREGGAAVMKAEEEERRRINDTGEEQDLSAPGDGSGSGDGDEEEDTDVNEIMDLVKELGDEVVDEEEEGNNDSSDDTDEEEDGEDDDENEEDENVGSTRKKEVAEQ